ncbi:uncharacterized protein LOC117298243 isoform X2 [Asterias rubens]|uniref:uncharacterized protein LOC117298243 isoform X2 n=1 Tax=Asterias rubens TaxID=7604 RepID=UPI0014552BF8|nr:uncharacterized protein LOC117298243 isoform X2 [Asterias rubens]
MTSAYSLRPCVYEPCFKVSVCLHEPVWNNTNDSSNISIEMLSLCVLLEQMYSKDQNKLQKQRPCLKKKFSNTFESQKPLIVDRMHTCLSALEEPSLTMKEYFERTGLSTLFPKVMCGLSQECVPSLSPLDGYFSHLSRLNQLMVLCKQIANDVTLGNHKYIAHQLALLHVWSGDSLVNIKTDIETRFRKLKSAIESQKKQTKPVLPQVYQSWLQDTATSLLDMIMDFSLELQQPLLPAIGFLQQSHHTASIS